MRIFIEFQEIWKAIEECPYFRCVITNGVSEQKTKDIWNDEDKKKIQYDVKVIDMLTSALGVEEFFTVSNCKSAKKMCDTLEITHEGTKYG
ncbi:hypothetical protein Lal_00036979 [Lupinus albus]|nr:hypothetical protein Lal_00036979 [Lupinus albus]